MTENTENNFYRLIAFLVDVAPNIVRKYFKRNILKAERFADYLDRNKHVLIHIWRRIKCCQCTKNQLSKNKCMSDKQFYLLFDNKKEKKNRLHKDECICNFEAKQNIELAVLDISLAFIVLINCEKLDYSVRQWLEQIKKIRNKMVHQSDVQSITSQDFQSIWENLESVLTGLALKVDSNCATELQSQISELQRKILIHEDELKIKKPLEEWITERYVAIEEIQQKCFEHMRTNHDQAEVNAGKSLEEVMNQTSTILTKIDILTAKVDAIAMTLRGNIAFQKLLEPSNDPDESSQKACKEAGKHTVEILMHLDIPEDWDKFKVIKAITNLQNMLVSLESNFTIQSYSTEFLDMFLDIKRHLLSNPVEFRKELQMFMTNLCKEAEVDVSKAASIYVTAEYLPEKGLTREQSVHGIQTPINKSIQLPQVNNIGNVLMNKDVFIVLELDSYGDFFKKAQTHECTNTTDPTWDEDFELELDGSKTIRILCYEVSSPSNILVGGSILELSKKWFSSSFKEQKICMNEMSLTISVRHPSTAKTLKRTPSKLQGGIFGFKIKTDTMGEGKTIPTFVSACIREVEQKGMDEVGIYRISGVTSEIQRIKKAFDKNLRAGMNVLADADIHAVTGVLKLYFRELPEPIFTEASYTQFVDSLALADGDSKEKCMLQLLHNLPGINYYCIVAVIEHLAKVSKHELGNKMSLNNLATIFGPTLLHPAVKDESKVSPALLIMQGAQDVFTQAGILYYFLDLVHSGRFITKSSEYDMKCLENMKL